MGRDFLPRSMPRERADRTWSKKLKYCYLRRGTLEMRKKVSDPKIQDRPWRNGSLATLMGGI